MKSTYQTECSTKAKREAMALKLQAVAESYGATWKRCEFAANNPYCLDLTIFCGPWRFRIKFNSKSNVGAYVVSVYTDTKVKTQLPAGFCAELGIEDNSYYGAKETIIEYEFDELAISIGVALRFLNKAIANGHDVTTKSRYA